MMGDFKSLVEMNKAPGSENGYLFSVSSIKNETSPGVEKFAFTTANETTSKLFMGIGIPFTIVGTLFRPTRNSTGGFFCDKWVRLAFVRVGQTLKRKNRKKYQKVWRLDCIIFWIKNRDMAIFYYLSRKTPANKGAISLADFFHNVVYL
jgi:hypothetical protein